MTETVYQRLMSGDGLGEHFDRHLFASLIAVARGVPAQPSAPSLTQVLGLSPDALRDIFTRFFPACPDLLPESQQGAADEDEPALEEEDLRELLLRHRTSGRIEEEWLATMIARRALCANHLWQDLGLGNRDELNRLMKENFASLWAANSSNMKWKKFFYRKLCEDGGGLVCKSPVCQSCDDYDVCFGEESGVPLIFRAPSPP